MKILFTRAPEDNEFAEKWMNGMAQEKKLKVERIHRKSDAMTAITAHRLLCFALKSDFGIMPAHDDWAAGEYGKPYLKNASNVHFSISHSGSMAMCVVDDSPVGADIEQIKPYQAGLEQRFMSEKEINTFIKSRDKIKLFYQIWTLKESYLKYTGQGLRALGEITVIPGECDIESNVSGCHFSLIDSISGYQAAVCSETAAFSAEYIGESTLNSF